MTKKIVTKEAPVWARFYICDDVRIEAAGKFSLMGLFPDSIVVVHLPRGVQPTIKAPLAIESLCILVAVHGLTGVHKARFALGSPELTVKPAFMERDIQFSENRAANLIVRMKPYVVRSFGKTKVQLEVAGHVFEHSFEIRRGELPQSMEPVKVVPAKKRRKLPRS